MRLVYQTLKQYRRILIGALVLATINQVFSLLDPQIFRIIVDKYASHPDQFGQSATMRGALVLVLALVGVALVSRVAKNFQDYFVNVVSQRVSTSLYARSVAHAFSLPYAVFEDQRSGELLQKMQKARLDIQTVITSFVNTVFLAFIGIVFVLVYAFTVHWSIGLAYAIALPTISAFTYLISRRIKTAQAAIVRESADLAGSTTETLRNVELVKSLGLERQEIGRLNATNERILNLELKKIRLIRRMSFIQGTLLNALRSGLILLMLWLIVSHAISLGQFFSIFIYSFFIFTPLADFGTVSAQFQEARASSGQLQKILNQPAEPKPEHPVVIDGLRTIEFQDASFVYQTIDLPSVERVSLVVRGGESVAFVGPSGAGKTTLVKLLLGLYQPSEGSLRLNGTDSRTVDYAALRQRIGLVSQETQLFAGSIRDNLLFVNPDASDRDCLDVLHQAAAESILERGGQGLETKIGEGGVKISGGERQRLAIARALLRKPDLLIFDEATSSLDSITERSITETIRAISNDRPNLMTVQVAHRLSTVAQVDRIYVLNHGRVVEQGNHASLLAQGGLYAALWREQSQNHGSPD